MLEMLSDVGKRQSLSEARALMEGLDGLRPAVLTQQLQHTERIKVVRPAAAGLSVPWASLVGAHGDRVGGDATRRRADRPFTTSTRALTAPD